MKNLSTVILAGLLFAANVSAQPASIRWPLNNSTRLNPTPPVGNITGSIEIISPGSAPAISVKDYWPGQNPGEAQRLWPGSSNWASGAEDANRFIEFKAAPTSGNSLTVTSVSFNFGLAGNHYGGSGISGRIRSNAYYSIDGWQTRTLMTTSGALQYPKTAMSSFVKNTPVFPLVPAGSTFSVRIYPYAIGLATVAPYFASHNMVTINGTTAPAALPTSSICGVKFNDVNGNGRQDAGEPGIKGWQITIGDLTVTTDDNGNYCFNDLKAGEYTIKEIMQSGWVQTAPVPDHYTVTLAAGQNIGDRNFGNRRATAEKLGSICGTKFNDLNGDGRQDAGEPGIPDWQISIGGSADACATTDEKGNYCFTDLKAGEYKIHEVMQSGWVQTAPVPSHYTVTLAAGQNIGDRNFGNRHVGTDTVKPDGPISVDLAIGPGVIMLAEPGSICGTKYYDINRNGVRDERGEGEPVLAGWTISISGLVDSTTTTDAQGNYCFTGLPPGTYTVSEVLQPNWQQTAPSSPGHHTVSLEAGQNIGGQNFGNWRVPGFPSAISGTKFNDANGNGVRDPGEAGLPGWQITINGSQTSFPGYLSSSVMTDAQGNYSFTGLWPGAYTIAEVMQPGWAQTAPPSGSYTVGIASGQGKGNNNFGNRRTTPDGPVVSPTGEAPKQLEKLMEAYRQRRMDAFLGFFAPDFRGSSDEVRRNTEKDWDLFHSLDIRIMPRPAIQRDELVEIEFDWQNNSRYRNGAAAERRGRSRILFRPSVNIFDRWGIIAVEGDPFLGVGLDLMTRPRVMSYSPRNGQSGVALNEAVVFEFSEDMDPGSLRFAFTIEPAIDLTYDASGRRYTVKPSAWRANTEYRVRLSDGATNRTGASLEAYVEFTFRTIGDDAMGAPGAGSPAW